jgi:hypothetical protein
MAKHPRRLFALAVLAAVALAAPARRARAQTPPSPPAVPASGAAPAPAASPSTTAAGAAAPPAEATTPVPAPPGSEAAWEHVVHERRGGFTFGIAPAFTLGTIAGFPNDARKINRAAYYTQTGVGAGAAGSFWIGGALTDWFTFGFGLAGNETAASGTRYRSVSFNFHLEAFPVYALGGPWRELGLFLETGLGSGTLTPKDDASTKLVDAGAASRIALGAFYEGVRFSRISMGPYASLEYAWSDSLRHGAGLVGWRAVLYTKKIEKAAPPAK